MLHSLVGQKIEGMRRTFITSLLSALLKSTHSIPAPTITLETPFHIDLIPSILRIFQKAWCMPVYRPPSAGFSTWRRVCGASAQSPKSDREWKDTFNRSTGYMTECSLYFISSACHQELSIVGANSPRPQQIHPPTYSPRLRNWAVELHSCDLDLV